MTFEFSPTENGFRIRDAVENVSIVLDVGDRSEPTPTSPDAFRAPLDAAVSVESAAVGFGQNFQVFARTDDGDLVDHSTLDGRLELERDTYELDTSLTGFKLYLRVVDVAVDVVEEPSGTRLSFDRPTTVTVGVRSHHQRPAGVVTTAQDPRDLMRAISTFGSALKTLSPERSFPTLRGHPPELAVRGETTIPDAFAPPDTGVTVEVPPDYAAVMMTAPLAYYFGATVEPSLEPRFRAEDVVFDLDPDHLASGFRDLLTHCFTLDATVRSVGLYPIETVESRAVLDRVSLDLEALYDLPIGERTARYLEIPFDATRDLVRWPAVADVDPVPLNAEALPYIAYRMAAVRSPAAGTPHAADRTPAESTQPPAGRDAAPAEPRSDSPESWDDGGRTGLVDPDPFDVEGHVWVADGLPTRGSKPTLGSYLRSTDATPHADAIDVHVVRGTDDHPSVDAIADRYTNDVVDVTLHDTPTTSELRSILTSSHDFLHFVGTVTADGLECADGPLDVRTLPRTGTTAFFLDGPSTYRQGLALVRAGAIAGVVTTAVRPRDDRLCTHLVSLVDAGFSIAAAVDVIARLDPAQPCTVVGDGDHQLCVSPSLPVLYENGPAEATADTVVLHVHVYPNRQHRIGTIVSFVGNDEDVGYLTGDFTHRLTRDAFQAVAERAEFPILAHDDLHWPGEQTAAELWTILQ